MWRNLDKKRKSGKLTLPQMIAPPVRWRWIFAALLGCLLFAGGQLPSARAEAMLQLFNVSWAEVAQKMPELAEAGYGSLWLPPPTKASGGLSVGYDLWDPFDLGSKDQRNTVRTRYGTEADLLHMMEMAHRFGLRVYFDNIMNHRAFDVPGFNETTPIDVYPGMVPEDFHLRKTEDGFYRKWDNTRDWNSAWQVQNLGLADLIDIAHETPNANFGTTEGSTHPKYSFVRDLERPAQYDRDAAGNVKYFGWLIDQARDALGTNATPEQLRLHARQYVADNANAYKEDVGGYLIRAARWKIDRTKADGLRLDAVKHVPDYFFGQQSGTNKDTSDAGYLGGVQRQFNLTRGFSDANHRDSVFDEKRARDDAMVFGEHLGQPPGYGGYWDAGMRLVDNDLRSKLNGVLGNPSAGLQGLDTSGAGGFSSGLGVTHANSHDSDFAAQKEWQHAFYMTREGMGLIYSDGFNKAETLGESGGAFPRHANTQYLGQFSDPRIPNILKIHNDFARGLQQGRWSDGDYLAFERRDNRNPDGSTRSGNAADEITMVVMMNDNTAQGVSRGISTSFPSGAYLYQYASGPGMSGFYSTAGTLGSRIVPPGGYFVFSYRTPETSTLWGSPITLHQTNASTGQLEEVRSITVTRKDGRDGDKSFNPYGLPNRGYPTNATPADYSYQMSVPVVKGGAPVTILARADGSAENILLKLDGGVNLNGTNRLGTDPGYRDNPPGLRTDVFLGYEQPSFTDRQHPEKFAAKDTVRCKIGSGEAETYLKTIGGGVAINNGNAANNYSNFSGNVASWVYHDPADTVGGPGGTPGVGDLQFNDSGSDIIIWAKSNSVGGGFQMRVYYTLDGSFPEGTGGLGRGTTRVAALTFKHNQGTDDWWGSATIPKPAPGTVFTYKIGAYKNGKTPEGVGTGAPSWWPADQASVDYKKQMLSTFRVADFNPATVQHFPHNDYARIPDYTQPYANWPWAMQTGLSEGFHVLRARAFLKRNAYPTTDKPPLDPAHTEAPLYQTFTQTFYYDAQTPQGAIAFPAANGDTVGGSSYEMVVRTDLTVEEVWYHIADADASNNDAATGQPNGNGAGFEPFTDANQNGLRDGTEAFTDINGNGTYDAAIPQGWAKATEVTPSSSITSPYQKEWRLRYNNIPATGQGTVTIRLLEASSSRDLTLGAAAAHVTELTRAVETRGPDERVNVAWPQRDGDRVDDNYTMKVYFTQALADGTTTETLKERFTFSIASQSSGSPAGAVIQTRDNFVINYNIGNGMHELAIPLPNLYNDISDFLHTLKVVYRFPDGREREATRLVTANPSTKPFVRISRPTELGSDGKPTEIILPDGPGADTLTYAVQVETNTTVSDAPVVTGITTAGVPTFTDSGSTRTWLYQWTITAPGNYLIGATATLNGQATLTSRNARVILRQVVEPDALTDNDDDHDGLVDINETNQKPLPTTLAETWTNGDVHIFNASGRSLPTSPDSDGDGLPDGLEVGWRVAPNPPTDPNADTNADGQKNFLGDLDPPLYAVVQNNPAVPGVGSQSAGDDRTRQAAGTMTDPNNPDSDGDGIPDGVEDANRNGWTDGDGLALPLTATIAQYTAARPNAGDWPNNIMEVYSPTAREMWTETSPTRADSDGDGLSDGFGEDKNFNGRIDGDTDFDRVYDAGEMWAEMDPLNPDTDGDGLADGWEDQYGLDPLDNGTTSLRTGGAGSPNNGASGDPDGDGRTNAQEQASGTNPTQTNTGGSGVGEGAINVGTFSDWTHNDLLALDEYNEGGSQAADVYRTNGNDNSRDIVAFSFRDGGAEGPSGNGLVYFRVDFMDLAPNAWQGDVDAYIVIDTGSPGAGERSMPNAVDVATDMRWEVVVAAYGQNFGSIFVDTNTGLNTATQFQNPVTEGGVEARAFSGTNLVQWSSRYDAVEIAIERRHLIDAGWDGDPNRLNFQVFTTMPNTTGAGSGDIAGRNDIRDTIGDDYLASDYWKDQDNIRLNGKLEFYFGRDLSQGNNGKKFNDRGKSSKVMLLAHGNQAIQPATVTQSLLRSGTPAVGYSRLVQTHEAYNAPLTLHLTPTLASALQWARNPNAGAWPNNDGPTFNTRLRNLMTSGRASLLGSTFADHVPKYFLQEFNNANKAVAQTFLDTIYGNGAPAASRSIFWAPERVLDTTSVETIRNMGYSYTFADQMRHFFKWFGRTAALGTDGYRINEVNGMKVFPIHDVTSEYLDTTLDEGSTLPVRQLLSRRSRSSVQDQVVVLWRDLNDFQSNTRASNYDSNVRWLASRPWIRVVTAAQIADGQVNYRGQDGNTYGTWGTVNRGNGQTLPQSAKDWVNWATTENYDNWYNRLSTQNFGANTAFGRVGVDGHANAAWNAAKTATAPNLQDVARAVIGGAMFQTGFHFPATPTDLSKFSTGDYINPASQSGQTMADFARHTQSQARFAAVYQRVQQWSAGATESTLGAEQADIDLDGANEYLLYNARVFAVFEAKGGRMTAAWMRSPAGQIWQVAGNFASYSNTETEDEGATNETAYRTSGFKDWWTVTGPTGSNTAVNDTYAVAAASGGETGWIFSQGGISKKITLPSATVGNLTAAYTLSGPSKLFVRFGLSPNLLDLMMRGHGGLDIEVVENLRASVANTSGGQIVRAWVEGPQINSAAVDTAATTTVRRRNQAQTHQVEVELTGAGPHVVTLGFDQGGGSVDSEPDGLPDAWELENFGNLGRDGTMDFDGDGFIDRDEYVAGSDPKNATSTGPRPSVVRNGTGFHVTFPTISGRSYRVVCRDNLTDGSWQPVTTLGGGQSNPAAGTGGSVTITDTSAPSSGARYYRIEVTLAP
jgi:hypothetical protein